MVYSVSKLTFLPLKFSILNRIPNVDSWVLKPTNYTNSNSHVCVCKSEETIYRVTIFIR